MKKLLHNQVIIFYLLLFCIVIIAFVSLEPKVSAMVFPVKRDIIRNSFFHTLEATKTLDPKQFWQFREFYSPGTYQFAGKGFVYSDIASSCNKMNLASQFVSNNNVFLLFSAPQLVSIDALVPGSSLAEALQTNGISVDRNSILSQGSNYLLVKNSTTSQELLFLEPVAALKKANGFSESLEKENILLKGKYWLDISLITD